MRIIFFTVLVLFFTGCSEEEPEAPSISFQLNSVTVGSTNLNLSDKTKNVQIPLDLPLTANFSVPLDGASLQEAITLKDNSGKNIAFSIDFREGDKYFTLSVNNGFAPKSEILLNIGEQLRGVGKETFPGIELGFTTKAATMELTSIKLDGKEIIQETTTANVSRNVKVELTFSKPLADNQLNSNYLRVLSPSATIPVTYSLSEDKKTVTMNVVNPLKGLVRHQVWASYELKGTNDEEFTQTFKKFYTEPSTDPVFPVISDEELLTLIQRQTFKYFYDYAEPVSGMSRERNGSGNLITSGGSGFGLMALVVGIERGFITREQGLQRLDKNLTFLEGAKKFHGAFPHWINGTNGQPIPFSTNDNGGDLVETSYLIQGLLTIRQYLNPSLPAEKALVDRINNIWKGVEWDWYQKGGQNVLYWHWSEDKGWIMNMQIKGWNECLITYVLAASSPEHSIPKSVYDQGWASNGNMKNGRTYEGHVLPLGGDYGGPLFFSHYSFLGLNPTGLKDAFCADYFTQNKNHSLINYAYCVRNPKKFIGYSSSNWGLTASDNQAGYSAHSPTNDLGVISPTAAVSSLPYTPEESLRAIRFFYFNLGDRLWGDYGFYDAFNITDGWTANSFLAIDQGPMIIMIENYRTGLLWNLFMSAPEVQSGLTKLGFTY